MNQIKHYKILENLGCGGMGVVYKAFDTVLERDVAIKVMHQHMLDNPQNEERFLREARAAAKLVHPNVVTIHEIGKKKNIRYIVMEYVNGTPLSNILQTKGALPWKRAVKLGCELLKGISSAHDLGILHRDIKSDNILLTDSGSLKILDFGIAKIKAKAGLTSAGDILGTVEYMSPEQMTGEELDTRSDIYSAAIVLYQMLVNKLPFTGDSAVTVLFKVLNEDPLPPSYYHEKIRPELDDVVLKALNRNKSGRWENCAVFIQALEDILDNRTVSLSVPKTEVPLEVDLLEEVDAESIDPTTLQPVFVGRRDEYRKFVKTYRNVTLEKGHTLVVKGESGVGKTTLANQFRKYSEKNQAWVLYGACLYQDGMDAYLPYVDALREFFSKQSYSLPDAERKKIKQMVKEKVPLLLEFTEKFTTSFGRSQTKNNSGTTVNQMNLFEGIYLLVSVLASIRPVVLIIDDLQWADDSSLRLFHYLARNVHGHRILQIGLSRINRHDLQKDGKPSMLVDVLARMRQEDICREIILNRLSREESDRLINDAFVKTVFSEDFYYRLYYETKGNPFFILETLKMLRDEEAIYLKDGVWYDQQDWKKLEVPKRVEDIFVRRLSALTDDEREILQVAAVIGYKVDVSILTLLMEISKIKLLKLLQRIERELQILTSTEEGFQFEHPMLRELLYNEIPNALRREYHLMIAEQMSNIYGENLGARLSDYAEHLRRGGKYEDAIPLLYQAALRAFRLSAYKDTSLLLENLMDAITKSQSELPDDASWEEIYFNLAISYEESGRWKDSIQYFKKFYELSKTAGNKKNELDALIRIGSLHVKLGDWESALSNYNHCMQIALKADYPDMLSGVFNNLGIVHFQKGELNKAVEYFEQTLDKATGASGKYDIAHALTNIGIISNIRNNHRAALKSYQDALKIYKTKKDSKREAQVYHNIGITYSDMNKWDKSIDAFEKCFKIAENLQDRGLIALTNLNIGKVYLRNGEKKLAKKHADKALVFFKRVADVLSIAEIYFIYGMLYSEDKNFRKAEKFFKESIKINDEKDYHEGLAESCEAYADLCRESGRMRTAKEYYSRAINVFRDMNAAERVSAIEKKLSGLNLSA